MHLFSVDNAYVNHVVCHNQKPGSWILCKLMLKIHQEQKLYAGGDNQRKCSSKD